MPYLSNYMAAGDPGFFGAIGRALKGGAVGMLMGGPAGALMGAGAGLAGVPGAGLPGTTGQLMSGGGRPLGPVSPRMGGGSVPGPYTGGPPPLTHIPGTPLAPQVLGGGQAPVAIGGGCPKGYRLNRSSYFLKSGHFIPKGTRCVRYRTRNNLNQRALRRAISRAQGFDKLVKKNRKSLRGLSRI